MREIATKTPKLIKSHFEVIYFCEEAPEYHIAAAGSLLGVAISRERYSFPVGKVIMKTLYPLGFDEFLMALGQNHLISMIREHFDAKSEMPAQLAKENRKFQYKLIRKGATAGLFGDSIAWLVQSGIVLQADKITRGEIPLIAFRDVSSFKLYMSDVGLLSAFSNIMPENIIKNQLSEIFRGALTENYVAQALKTKGYGLYYRATDSPLAELDFAIQKEGKAIPIEVKSGENVNAKSLKHFRKMYNPEMSIRLSEKNFGYDDGLYAVPLYAAFCI